MSLPVNCPYFFGDYHRGREIEKCRLIERNRDNRRPWRRALCDTCPVPAILRLTTCRHLALEASVTRKFGLLARVAVYAVCTEHVLELADPRRCPLCEEEERNAERVTSNE
ncbi:MAG: hypothetical protein AUK03_05770 [Anaerolineae bacterium CG2_30_64_16]|nr:MAG: hypothetical protein AUK03_05770 [Anaerolineae bacterium CG2_30_64_16]